MKRHSWIAALALVALGGCVNRAAQQEGRQTQAVVTDRTPVVQIVKARQSTVEERLEINGQLTSGRDTTIGAKVAGKLVSVFVRDGDPVKAGQVIAVQETSVLFAQLRQAEGQVAAARAQLSQALSNMAINPKRTASAVRSAEAQLATAKAQYEKARRGARDEERRQAENAVEAAKSNLDTAQKEMDRQRRLYEAGATSQQRYEVAQNQYQQALAQYRNALEALEMSRNWTRPEDLEAAREAVRQAEEALRTARAQKELDVVYAQQVAAARANLQSAIAAADMIRTQMADATIRAPFAGVISGQPAQVGEVLTPGTPVARLIGTGGVYFEGEVPETEIDEIEIGRLVTVRLAAIEGRTFVGRVLAINPLGQSVGRIFKARIGLEGAGEMAKPGMFATGSIQLRTIPDAVIVPQVSVVRGDDGAEAVFVIRDGKARRVKVMRGLEKGDWVQVSGLEPGSEVVRTGQTGLRDGIEVRVDTNAAGARSSAQEQGS